MYSICMLADLSLICLSFEVGLLMECPPLINITTATSKTNAFSTFLHLYKLS